MTDRPRHNGAISWVAGHSPDPKLERAVAGYLAPAPRPSLRLPEGMTRVQQSLIALVRLYQRRLSPRLGRTCIFEPSCSDYATLAIAYNGVVTGTSDALRRWVRCRPSSTGGIDYPRGCDVSDREHRPGLHEQDS
jgi:putative membrane protein insertion efficiency factor